jgi:uncharacterized protein (TIGR02265 family)
MHDPMAVPISGKLVDGVFRRALGPELPSELRARLLAEGLDLAPATLAPSYPRPLWYQAVALTAAALYPAEAPDAQLRRLGRHVLEALQARGAFKTGWVGVARLLGPRRALLQAAGRPEHLPVKVHVKELARTRFELWTEERQQAEFLAGLLEGTCALLGGKEPTVQVIGERGDGMVLMASWR